MAPEISRVIVVGRDLSCQGHSCQSYDYKEASEYLLVEFHRFSFVVHVPPGSAFTLFHVDTSECRPSGSVLVALSVRVRIDHGSMLIDEGSLRFLRQFRFHRFGINEFVPSFRAGIKPGHESGRLCILALGKRD